MNENFSQSASSRDGFQVTAEAKVVRNALDSITGASFEIATSDQIRLLRWAGIDWVVARLQSTFDGRTGRIDRVWRDASGSIWFETFEIADLFQLVERHYGKDGTSDISGSGIGKPKLQANLKEILSLPRVLEQLDWWERIIFLVGEREGVDIRLLYDGSGGKTAVRIAIRTSFSSTNAVETKEVVERVEKALKEAYDLALEATMSRM